MAYELNAEGSNGVNGTTSISNLGGFDFGVLLQLDGSQSDAIVALTAAAGAESAAVVASGNAGVVGIRAEYLPNGTLPPASTLPPFQACGAGVLGISDAAAVALFVPPENDSATDFIAGVKGVSTAAVGVGGVSQNGTGVYATSNSGYGVDAFSTENVAVHAISTKGIGLYAQSGTSPFAPGRVAGSLAGLFVGPVQVAGSFTVFGPKSAAVKVSAGSYRQLFCLEAPESCSRISEKRSCFRQGGGQIRPAVRIRSEEGSLSRLLKPLRRLQRSLRQRPLTAWLHCPRVQERDLEPAILLSRRSAAKGCARRTHAGSRAPANGYGSGPGSPVG